MPELSTMPSRPLLGFELLPLLQGLLPVGAITAELGDVPRGAIALRRVRYKMDTGSTAAGDPGAGRIRYNHVVQSAATEIYLSDVDLDAEAHAGAWSGLSPGGYVYAYAATSLDVLHRWSVVSVHAEVGYLRVVVDGHAGAGEFSSGAVLNVTIQQPDLGATLPEAPIDGKTYGRRDAAWAKITSEAAPVISLPGTAYTLSDLTPGAWHVFSAVGAVAITVEDDAVAPVPMDAEYMLDCTGAGGVTLVEDSAAVIDPPKGGTLALETGDVAVLKRRAADRYKLAGSTVDAA